MQKKVQKVLPMLHADNKKNASLRICAQCVSYCDFSIAELSPSESECRILVNYLLDFVSCPTFLFEYRSVFHSWR